jgi:5'-deoxynucleotidase
MPTPVKYHSAVMREAFRNIEHKASDELLALLPDDLREDFAPYIQESRWQPDVVELVKAADRLSALLKCEAEIQAGNREFEPAAKQIRERLEQDRLAEVTYFLEVFAPGYSQPLDHLLGDAEQPR